MLEDATRFSSPSVDAISIAGHTLPLLVNWSVSASNIDATWNHRWGPGITNPASPGSELFSEPTNTDFGEKNFTSGTARQALMSNTLELLVLSDSPISNLKVEGATSSPAKVSPAGGQAWNAGIGSYGDPASPWREDHGTRAGSPIASMGNDTKISAIGDFSLYVWTGDVNIQSSSDAPQKFKTGEWTEPGPAGGPAHETHQQLLALHVKGGRLDLGVTSGALYLEAPRVSTITQGNVAFSAEKAYVESDKYVYTATGGTVRIGGNVSLAASRLEGSPAALNGVVTGTGFSTDLVPSAPVAAPEPAGVGSDLRNAQGHGLSSPGAEKLVTPSSQQSIWILLTSVTLLLLACLAAAAWLLVRRFGARFFAAAGQPAPVPPVLLLQQAERALVDGDAPGARAFVRDLLTAAPTHVDAWFIHGASLLQEKAFQKVATDLEPVTKKLRTNREGLAFLLCLAFLNLGRLSKARRWSTVAAADPEFRLQLERDETFKILRAEPAPKRAAVPALFERGESLDVAYG